MRKMMISYSYYCYECEWEDEILVDSIEDRNNPCSDPCPNCGKTCVKRAIGSAAFKVPEGAVGNAANGYSSYHGDSENFKAGRKIYK